MSRIRLMAALTVALLLASTAAFAQSSASGQTGAQGNAQVTNTTNTTTTDANASMNANASAEATAKADAEQMKRNLTDRAAKVSSKARAKADADLELAAKAANDKAEQGEDVASRLAGEFNMTAEAITNEKSSLDASWGNLMIAHTLAANSKSGVTAAQLIELKKDGMGWGQIAAGLGYDLGSAVRASKAESKIAAGEAQADGHAAVINGEGAKAGVGATAGLNAATRGAHVKAGAGVGVGTGVKIGH
jgi:hypothetical protein